MRKIEIDKERVIFGIVVTIIIVLMFWFLQWGNKHEMKQIRARRLTEEQSSKTLARCYIKNEGLDFDPNEIWD